MSTPQAPSSKPEGPVITNTSVLFARVTWIMIGPLFLLILLLAIIRAGTGWTTGLDAAYLVALGAMIAGRWYEIRSGQASTSDGQPATWGHFRRYVLVLVPLAVAAWALANMIGNHLLNRPV